MTTRNSFRKLPPFSHVDRIRSNQLVCDPRSYVRAFDSLGRPLWAPCLSWARGPVQYATTGDGSFTTLYSASWLLQMCLDGSWVLYQRAANESLIVQPWDTVPTTATSSARHPALAFDQAARPHIAWEDESGIWIREYDEIAGSYQVIGPFTGLDPILICDATVNYHVAGSDVILFYLSSDRTKLMYRIQNENFGTEHEHYDYGEVVVLDASDIGGYRIQIRYSDEQGSVIGPQYDGFTVLLSDVYPIYVNEEMLGQIGELEDGEYVLVVMKRPEVIEQLEASIGSLEDGVYFYAIIPRDEVIEQLEGTIGSLEDGVYFYAIIPRDEVIEGVEGSVGSLEDGIYFYTIINRNEVIDSIVGSVGSLEDGVYAAA